MRCWHPYHRALRDLVEATHSRFGQAILIDCHSMPHEALEHHGRPGRDLPDVVLGDRFGAAAAPWVMTAVEAAFQAEGFRVSRNTPFAGAFIAQSYGRPSAGRHVVQIEIDRALYMNESTIEPLPDFPHFTERMARVVQQIAGIDHIELITRREAHVLGRSQMRFDLHAIGASQSACGIQRCVFGEPNAQVQGRALGVAEAMRRIGVPCNAQLGWGAQERAQSPRRACCRPMCH